MHSKGGYKISICLVILGELEAFQNYKDFSFIFPNILESIALNVLRKWEFFFFLFEGGVRGVRIPQYRTW